MLTEKEINIITGKAMALRADPDDILSVMEHIQELYALLDELDTEDFFGTEGWRHFLGVEES